MAVLETLAVILRRNGKPAVINKQDLDPIAHALPGEKVRPSKAGKKSKAPAPVTAASDGRPSRDRIETL